ncbi:MAG: YbjQ family protein [Ruminococcus sp.]|nr:YbjQ family protein [Ruminococcus sp.]
MLIVNTPTIEGAKLQTLGIVSGNTVQSKNAFKDIGAAFRNLVGGEVVSYTKMLNEAREEAIRRMVQQATSMGADAVVNVRFSSASIMEGAAELLVWGTAVKIL